MDKFQLVSDYKLSGDQPEAVDALVKGIESGMREQTLMGVTGSGKTFTMANVIARINRPTLVLAHNKILAAQLCSEFKEFFPNNAVEYFVSYYDYYQPEAYVPSKDVYIEKDSSVNDEIDKLRHSATSAIAERRDVIIVASVSCIYSLGDPEEYKSMVVSIRRGMEKSRDRLIADLVGQAAVDVDPLAQALGGNFAAFGVHELVLQGRTTGINNQNVHWNLLRLKIMFSFSLRCDMITRILYSIFPVFSTPNRKIFSNWRKNFGIRRHYLRV